MFISKAVTVIKPTPLGTGVMWLHFPLCLVFRAAALVSFDQAHTSQEFVSMSQKKGLKKFQNTFYDFKFWKTIRLKICMNGGWRYLHLLFCTTYPFTRWFVATRKNKKSNNTTMKKKNYPLISLSALLVFSILINSCKKEDAPSLATTNVADIAITTAISGGNVTSDGGASVTARGVCWGPNTAPTIADNKTSDGTGTGIFSSSITGLTANTKYYLRAYATNTEGTAYGSEKTFTTYGVLDIDGNKYHTIKIGTQEWMKENLKTKKYSDGSAIPNITNDVAWVNSSTGAYCDFNNAADNVAIYGRLYNLFAVADTRNVCPDGWHVPSLTEWDILINNLGGENVAGGKMKSIGTLQNNTGLWHSPNTGATNESGFTGLPGGTRFTDGDFRDLHSYGHWRASDGLTLRLQDNHPRVEKFNFYATNGSSVRCVKD